jgi:L-fuconolactonase
MLMGVTLQWAARGSEKAHLSLEVIKEECSMPDFSVVDTHLHIWDIKALHYPWLEHVPFLNRSFIVKDYQKACGDVDVEKMVFVQAEADFSLFKEEVDWVSACAETDDRIKGIVAWAPLEKGQACNTDLVELKKRPLLRGIRRIIQFEEDIEFCLRNDFIDGLKLLPKHDLTFDICINHKQLANTIKMVEKCPEVTFILDHIGKPDIRHQEFTPWKEEMKVLSDFPNVWCKMSGLVTEADFDNWTRDDLKPYIDHVINCFGFDRTMYGGDWPVAFQATDYPRWVETLQWALSGSSHEEMQKLFHDNGERFYRI